MVFFLCVCQSQTKPRNYFAKISSICCPHSAGFAKAKKTVAQEQLPAAWAGVSGLHIDPPFPDKPPLLGTMRQIN